MNPSSRVSRLAKRLAYRIFHSRRPLHSITASCCGLRFRFDSNYRIGEDLYANAFERRHRAVLDRVLTPGSTVLDVGANIGFYTCLFAQKVGPQGQVIAVEPTPHVFQNLQSNIALNAMGERVTPLRIALSDEAGTAAMNVFPAGNEVYNSLGATADRGVEGPVASIKVDTATLDSLLAELPQEAPCFIKIDVEGFQHKVIEGGRRLLKEMPQVALMVELDDTTDCEGGASAAETLNLLRDCGFEAYVTTGDGQLAALTESGDRKGPLNDNFFFFKKPPSIAKAA